MSEIRVGDIVSVKSPGHQYSTYETMAVKMGMRDWKAGDYGLHNDFNTHTYKVVAIQQHMEYSEQVVVGVRNTATNHPYLIELKGLKLVRKGNILSEDLFEL